MRIIAGKFRTRRLKLPKDVKIRPTQDRVREALFNILGGVVKGSSVLDLFAGSGAFGLEAISRGAQAATFVDKDPRCIDIIKANIGILEVKSITKVLRLDVDKAIKKLATSRLKFDLIFLDPPYYKGFTKKTLQKIDNCDILKSSGLVVAEHFKKDEAKANFFNLTLCRSESYGDTTISFYKIKKL